MSKYIVGALFVAVPLLFYLWLWFAPPERAWKLLERLGMFFLMGFGSVSAVYGLKLLLGLI